jgi:hypothetical protein
MNYVLNMNRIWLVLLLLGMFAGCADAQRVEMAGEPAWDIGDMAYDEAEMVRTGAALPPMEPGTDFDTPLLAVAQERLIIRTGQMSIVVIDTETALADIVRLAETTGGWVVSSNIYQYDERAKMGSITVRVPAKHFDDLVTAVKETAVSTTRESTDSRDVTEEYVDLSARLDNLEATADRVRAFLDEARNVEEALDVNRELSRLEEQIEVIKGRMQYLSQSAAYSTLTVEIQPDVLSQPLAIGGWEPQGTARAAVEALVTVLQGLVKLAIWLLIFIIPLAILVGGPIWLIIRTFRRRRTATPAAGD